jgi:Zn-dependent M32 family carboxypeptidase
MIYKLQKQITKEEYDILSRMAIDCEYFDKQMWRKLAHEIIDRLSFEELSDFFDFTFEQSTHPFSSTTLTTTLKTKKPTL